MGDLCFYMTKDQQIVYSLPKFEQKKRKKKKKIVSLNWVWQLDPLCHWLKTVHSNDTSINQDFLILCPYSYSPTGFNAHICECCSRNVRGIFSYYVCAINAARKVVTKGDLKYTKQQVRLEAQLPLKHRNIASHKKLIASTGLWRKSKWIKADFFVFSVRERSDVGRCKSMHPESKQAA